MAAEYEFHLAGRIEPGALAGFDGMTVVQRADDTIMRGHLDGQSAVLGVLARLHALGLTLLELRRTESPGGVGAPVDLPVSVALAIGLMGGIAEGAAAGFRQGRKVAGSLLPAVSLLRRLPGGEGASRVLRDRVDTVSRRGSADFAASVAQAKKAWSSALSRIGDDPDVSTLVRRIADRAVGPVIDTALPLVLDRLATDPQHIRHILGVQSFGMTEEVTETIRERTATADDQVERFAHRLMRRRERKGPGTPPPLSHEA